jgi:hypothetical protein
MELSTHIIYLGFEPTAAQDGETTVLAHCLDFFHSHFRRCHVSIERRKGFPDASEYHACVDLTLTNGDSLNVPACVAGNPALAAGKALNLAEEVLRDGVADLIDVRATTKDSEKPSRDVVSPRHKAICD